MEYAFRLLPAFRDLISKNMGTEVIRVTDAAREYISKHCENGKKVMRIAVNGKGCSGHKYDYSMVLPDQCHKLDEMISWPGGGVLIDGTSVMHLIGSTLDLRSDVFGQTLVWINPNAVGLCGCGKSFASLAG